MAESSSPQARTRKRTADQTDQTHQLGPDQTKRAKHDGSLPGKAHTLSGHVDDNGLVILKILTTVDDDKSAWSNVVTMNELGTVVAVSSNRLFTGSHLSCLPRGPSGSTIQAVADDTDMAIVFLEDNPRLAQMLVDRGVLTQMPEAGCAWSVVLDALASKLRPTLLPGLLPFDHTNLTAKICNQFLIVSDSSNPVIAIDTMTAKCVVEQLGHQMARSGDVMVSTVLQGDGLLVRD